MEQFNFDGMYQYNVDAKGRLLLPAKFREQMGETMVLSHGYDQNLYLLPPMLFAKKKEQAATLPITNKNVRAYKTMYIDTAQTLQVDNQGRIALTPMFIKNADIKKQCVLIGSTDHIQIWALERWEVYLQQQNESASDILENIEGLL